MRLLVGWDAGRIEQVRRDDGAGSGGRDVVTLAVPDTE